MTSASAPWRSSSTLAHTWPGLLWRTLAAALFAALAVSWPGAVLLSILYTVMGYAAVVAGVSLHTILLGKRRTWILQALGSSALGVGVAALILSGNLATIAPAVVAAWLVVRAKDGWSLIPSTVLLAFGLLLLSGFGDHPARVLGLIGVHAVTTGTLLLGLAPRPPRARYQPSFR